MRKLIAISLALLMLIISLKVSVDFHYCAGKLAQFKIVIGSGNASCGMEESKNNCKTHSSSSFNKSSCCENQIKQIKTDDFQSVINFVQPSLEYIQVLNQINIIPFAQGAEISGFLSYRTPPDITSVFLPFIEVFRI